MKLGEVLATLPEKGKKREDTIARLGHVEATAIWEKFMKYKNLGEDE